MILGMDTSTAILIALIPTTFTMVVGLMAWVIRSLNQLHDQATRNELALQSLEEKLK